MSSSPEPSSPPTAPAVQAGPAATPAAPAEPVTQPAAEPLSAATSPANPPPRAHPSAPGPAPVPAPPAAIAGQPAHEHHAARAERMPARQRKSPVVAGLLSLMPGAGQIYVGYYRLGFIHNIIFAANIAFLAGGGGPFPSLAPAAAIFLPFFVIYNIVDAGRRATLYNLALDGMEGIELPSLNMDAALPLPSIGGSVGGGAILIVVSVILLSNTLLGISLDWIAAWWPAAPLGLGVYLLVKGLKERQAAAAPPAAAQPSTAKSAARGSDGPDSASPL